MKIVFSAATLPWKTQRRHRAPVYVRAGHNVSINAKQSSPPRKT